jgi:hypothetical protein
MSRTTKTTITQTGLPSKESPKGPSSSYRRSDGETTDTIHFVIVILALHEPKYTRSPIILIDFNYELEIMVDPLPVSTVNLFSNKN